MSNQTINIQDWIESAKSNAAEHFRRQAVEVLLASISSIKELRETLFLKGGTLMNLVYQSPRTTKDIDFTSTEEPSGFAEYFATKMDAEMRVTAARLGFVDYVCKVQSWEMKPPEETFPWPTLRVKIGFAKRGSNQESQLVEGKSSNVLRLDISFNEPVIDTENLLIEDDGRIIKSYSIYELIAEKYRAILQQDVRNRKRGQDVYDISKLVSERSFSKSNMENILKILITKAEARNLKIHNESLRLDTLIKRLEESYAELVFDVGEEEIDFQRDMKIVKKYYESLPWK